MRGPVTVARVAAPASNLNVLAGGVISNLVTVKIGSNGRVDLYNNAGSVHLIADLAGYYTTGATSSWHTAAAPVPPGTPAGSGVTLAGVACAGTAGCVATGHTDSAGRSQALLLTWTGTSWTPVDAPLPPDAAQPAVASFDQAPVCPSAGTCLALGSYQTTGGGTAYLVARGFGATWTTGKLPVPAGATLAYEPGLACGPTGCVAATADHVGAAADQIMLVTGDPGTDVAAWTARQAPVPAGGGTDLGGGGAGCGPTACTVSASRTDSAGVIHPYLITGSGATWTAADAPLPDGDAPPVAGTGQRYELGGPHCGPAACAVTGTYWAGNEDPVAVMLTGDGSAWSASNIPQPADVAHGYAPTFDSVVCPTADRCLGTAYYGGTASNGNSGYAGVLVSGWSGSGWTEFPLTGPDQRSNGTFTLACPTTTCVVAGGYRDSWGTGQLAVGSGTLPASAPWPSRKVTPPPNAYYTSSNPPQLRVACASESACVAVGTYWDNTGTSRGVLLTGAATGP